jgi:hypothetical protein
MEDRKKYTTKSSKTGTGASITRGRLEMHKIWYDSLKGS